MSEQSTCKWCGAKVVVLHRNTFSHCGTWISTSNHAIIRRSARCERDELRQRIDAAIKALQDISRFKVYAYDEFVINDRRHEHGEWVQWDDLDDVAKILRGNSPTNQESSS